MVRRLAIFDCDGTLVDSQHHICLCMARTFEDAGLTPPDDAAVRRLVGLSLNEFVATLLPDAEPALHARVIAGYRTAFAELCERGGMDTEPLFDGIAPMLAALQDAGWTLGVATGKSDRGLIRVLTAHGLLDRFATLQTADRHPSKPHPAMIHAALAESGIAAQDAVMIGDTSFDIAMARAADVSAIGVGWGYHPATELRDAGAAAVAETVSGLPRLLAA